MQLDRIRIFYLNLLFLLFIYLKLEFLFLLIFIIRNTYFFSKENNIFYDFNNYEELTYNIFIYLDVDLDTEIIESIIYKDAYLLYNCHFFFDFHGGEKTIETLNYFYNEFFIFNKKNLINIYKKINFKKYFDKKSFYILYYFKEIFFKRLNHKIYIKKMNENNFFILENKENMNKLNFIIKKKRMNFYKTIRNI